MDMSLPSVDHVRSQLLLLSYAGVKHLAKRSGVPFTTLWKIRDGTTANPGIETVRQFWPELADIKTPEGA
ncbi:MAG TPA: hypothetical protein VMA55_10125 [Acidovorax sp.]|nr:hypothetical protein [Acidovorax sp.]